MCKWKLMSDEKPIACEILFIAKHDITDERIGIAVPDSGIVLLKRTDISFDNITHWMQIPEVEVG